MVLAKSLCPKVLCLIALGVIAPFNLHAAASANVAAGEVAQAPRTQVEDYGSTTPLPQTGRVTIRRSLQQFNSQRLFAPCPTGSQLSTYAESTHYQIQLCAVKGTPRYYLSRDKRSGQRSQVFQVEEKDPQFANQRIFRKGRFQYILYRDGRNPERQNAYLQVFEGNQYRLGEALIYLYER